MKKLSWAAKQRQNYIGERLRSVGTLNRNSIEKEFEISPQQASNDIAHFLNENPGMLDYDRFYKMYIYQGEKPKPGEIPLVLREDYKAGFKAGMEFEAQNRLLTDEKPSKEIP